MLFSRSSTAHDGARPRASLAFSRGSEASATTSSRTIPAPDLALRRSSLHLVSNYDAVTPRSLGLIEGSVGGSRHLLPTLAVVGKYRDAHGYRDGSDSPALVLDLEVLHVPAEFFGSLRDCSLRARSHDQNELFAAIARDDILAPRSGQHVLAYCSQHRISCGVAERVVEAFEVVDVDHHYAEGQAAAPGAALFPAERLLEVAAVMEAGPPALPNLGFRGEGWLRQFPPPHLTLCVFLPPSRPATLRSRVP